MSHPLQITNTKNQRQIPSEDLFLRSHLKKFLLSIFDYGCMSPTFKNPRYATVSNASLKISVFYFSFVIKIEFTSLLYNKQAELKQQ